MISIKNNFIDGYGTFYYEDLGIAVKNEIDNKLHDLVISGNHIGGVYGISGSTTSTGSLIYVKEMNAIITNNLLHRRYVNFPFYINIGSLVSPAIIISQNVFDRLKTDGTNTAMISAPDSTLYINNIPNT